MRLPRFLARLAFVFAIVLSPALSRAQVENVARPAIQRVQANGSNVPRQATINFIGSGVVAADNPGAHRTDVTLSATTSGGFNLLGSDPLAPTTGQVWFNTGTSKFSFYDGAATLRLPANYSGAGAGTYGGGANFVNSITLDANGRVSAVVLNPAGGVTTPAASYAAAVVAADAKMLLNGTVGPLVLDRDAQQFATIGLSLQNNTATTALAPTETPPAIEFIGGNYNTGTTLNETFKWRFWPTSTGTGSTGFGAVHFKFQYNSGDGTGYHNQFAFVGGRVDGAGNGNLTMRTGVTAAAGFPAVHFYDGAALGSTDELLRVSHAVDSAEVISLSLAASGALSLGPTGTPIFAVTIGPPNTLSTGSSDMAIRSNNNIYFGDTVTTRLVLTSSAQTFSPFANNVMALGDTTHSWTSVYALEFRGGDPAGGYAAISTTVGEMDFWANRGGGTPTAFIVANTFGPYVDLAAQDGTPTRRWLSVGTSAINAGASATNTTNLTTTTNAADGATTVAEQHTATTPITLGGLLEQWTNGTSNVFAIQPLSTGTWLWGIGSAGALGVNSGLRLSDGSGTILKYSSQSVEINTDVVGVSFHIGAADLMNITSADMSPAASGGVVLGGVQPFGNIRTSGKLTTYNGETTAGVGVRYEEKVGQDVASSGAGAQSTTIATFSPATSGLYHVEVVISCTTADTVSAVVTYTDAVNTTAQTLTPISSVSCGTNSTTSARVLIRANTSTAILAKISLSSQATTKASAAIERLN